VIRLWWAILATVLVLLSVQALTVIASTAPVPFGLRDSLWDFAQPGTTVWWFTFGGPFRTGPSSPAGIAFAAVANSALWLCLAGIFFVIFRLVRRLVSRPRGLRD
jgi:hypothetical protein